MPVSKFKRAQIEKMKKEAIQMYKKGMSTRSIGKVLGVSHTYIWKLIGKELSTASPAKPLDNSLQK